MFPNNEDNFEDGQVFGSANSFGFHWNASSTIGHDMEEIAPELEESYADDLQYSQFDKVTCQFSSDDIPLHHYLHSSTDGRNTRTNASSTGTCLSASTNQNTISSSSSRNDRRARATSCGVLSPSVSVKPMKGISPIDTRQGGGTISVGSLQDTDMPTTAPVFKTTLGQQSSEGIQTINKYISTRKRASTASNPYRLSAVTSSTKRSSETSDRCTTPFTGEFGQLRMASTQMDDASTASQSPAPVASPVDTSIRRTPSFKRRHQSTNSLTSHHQKTVRTIRPRPVKRASHSVSKQTSTSSVSNDQIYYDPAHAGVAMAESLIDSADS